MTVDATSTPRTDPAHRMPPAVRAALATYRKALERDFGDRVLRVTLYGSMARGDAHEESDVDVLVVLDSLETGERSHALDLGGAVGLETGLVLAPLVLCRAEWDELVRRERLLPREIERDGIEA